MSQYLLQECFDLKSSIAIQERLPAQKLTSFESCDASLTSCCNFWIVQLKKGTLNIKQHKLLFRYLIAVMHKALCLFINLIKLHWWGGDVETIVIYVFVKFALNKLFNGNWLLFKHSKKKKTLTYSNVPPNSGGTFLANRLVKCPATALICTCFLVWSSSDIPRSSLMVFTASSWYRLTTHAVCAASLPMVVARNASLNAPCANLVSSI